MKLTVSLLLIFAWVLPSFAQDQLTIRYRLQYPVLTNKPDTDSNFIYKWVTDYSSPEYELAINDRLASFRNTGSLLRPYTHNHFPGDTVIAYTDLKEGFNYIPVPPITEKALMVRDPAKKFSWSFTTFTDTICGFPCRMAITIVENNYVYAWYAFDLPPYFGPLGYTGLPGTILSLEFGNSTDRYRAQSVSDVSGMIIIPETAHIGPDEYAGILKEKRSYRGGLFGRKVDPWEVPKPRIITSGGRMVIIR